MSQTQGFTPIEDAVTVGVQTGMSDRSAVTRKSITFPSQGQAPHSVSYTFKGVEINATRVKEFIEWVVNNPMSTNAVFWNQNATPDTATFRVDNHRNGGSFILYESNGTVSLTCTAPHADRLDPLFDVAKVYLQSTEGEGEIPPPTVGYLTAGEMICVPFYGTPCMAEFDANMDAFDADIRAIIGTL